MKKLLLLPILVSLFLQSCGPSKSELRSELQQIEGEMMAISIAMNDHRSRMGQAEFDAFIGSFAAGYGLTSRDFELAGQGANTAAHAIQQYDVSAYSLEQLTNRYFELGKQRMLIRAELRK